jgi:hypothetical protein
MLRDPLSIGSGFFVLHRSMLGSRLVSIRPIASCSFLARVRFPSSVLANAYSGVSEAAQVDVRHRILRIIESKQFFRMLFPRAAYVEVPRAAEILDADEPHHYLIGQSLNSM